MAKRSKSSGRWLDEHHNDEFVLRARAEGWRSRAVYKLEEIARAERLFKPDMVAVDLGAAPGSWSQYLARYLKGTGEVFALDILPMEGVHGVTFVEGDFRDEVVYQQLVDLLAGRPVDLVLSDMAPNMSGVDAVDQPRAMYLAELALEFAAKTVKPGGAFLSKVFQGAGFESYVKAARVHFTSVRLKKPKASRPRSPEVYLLATGRRAV
jgi:23S rRNA (uridine2552-2'-O)-methyltransferase